MDVMRSVRPFIDPAASEGAAAGAAGSFWNVPRISTRRFISCWSVVCSPPVSRSPLPATPAVPMVELGSAPVVLTGAADGGVVIGGGVVVGGGVVGGGVVVGGVVAGGGVVVAGGVLGVVTGVVPGLPGFGVSGPAVGATVGFARMKPGVIVVVVPAGPVAMPPCTQPVTVTICGPPGDVVCGGV